MHQGVVVLNEMLGCNGVMLTANTELGFHVLAKYPPPTHIITLINKHEERLIGLLDTAMVVIRWDDGDDEQALATIMPVDPTKELSHLRPRILIRCPRCVTSLNMIVGVVIGLPDHPLSLLLAF
jgi:hypothetical protein